MSILRSRGLHLKANIIEKVEQLTVNGMLPYYGLRLYANWI